MGKRIHSGSTELFTENKVLWTGDTCGYEYYSYLRCGITKLNYSISSLINLIWNFLLQLKVSHMMPKVFCCLFCNYLKLPFIPVVIVNNAHF